MKTPQLAVAAALVTLMISARAVGHPGQHMDLRIHIDDQAVTYTLLLSTDLANLVHVYDYTDFTADRANERFVPVAADFEAQIRRSFEDYFRDRNPIEIDGMPVKPVLDSIAFVPNPTLAGQNDPYTFPPDMRMVLRFDTKGPPKQVAMVWDLYPQDVTRAAMGLDPTVEVVAELDAYDENRIIMFTADEPEVIWHSERRQNRPHAITIEPTQTAQKPTHWVALSVLAALGLMGCWGMSIIVTGGRMRRLAWGGVLLAGAGVALALGGDRLWQQTQRVPPPTASEAEELFERLQRNVYRAFDYKSESDIYDVLAQSVDGPLLDEVYNEVFRSLILRDQGGAVARVQSVDVLDAELRQAETPELSAFRVQGRWRVQGAVYHWGHVHTRTNEYNALYTIAQRGESWKITAVDQMEQRRIVQEGDDPPDTPPPAAEPM